MTGSRERVKKKGGNRLIYTLAGFIFYREMFVMKMLFFPLDPLLVEISQKIMAHSIY